MTKKEYKKAILNIIDNVFTPGEIIKSDPDYMAELLTDRTAADFPAQTDAARDRLVSAAYEIINKYKEVYKLCKKTVDELINKEWNVDEIKSTDADIIAETLENHVAFELNELYAAGQDYERNGDIITNAVYDAIDEIKNK